MAVRRCWVQRWLHRRRMNTGPFARIRHERLFRPLATVALRTHVRDSEAHSPPLPRPVPSRGAPRDGSRDRRPDARELLARRCRAAPRSRARRRGRPVGAARRRYRAPAACCLVILVRPPRLRDPPPPAPDATHVPRSTPPPPPGHGRLPLRRSTAVVRQLPRRRRLHRAPVARGRSRRGGSAERARGRGAPVARPGRRVAPHRARRGAQARRTGRRHPALALASSTRATSEHTASRSG